MVSNKDALRGIRKNYVHGTVEFINYLKDKQKVTSGIAQRMTESVRRADRVMVGNYTVCFCEDNPSTAGRLFTQWLPLYLNKQGIKVEENAIIIFFVGKQPKKIKGTMKNKKLG